VRLAELARDAGSHYSKKGRVGVQLLYVQRVVDSANLLAAPLN
jgi:hypothetical protein